MTPAANGMGPSRGISCGRLPDPVEGSGCKESRTHRFRCAGWTVVGGLLLSLLLAGCGGSGDTSRADLVFINGAEVSGIDPTTVSDQISGRVVTALFEGLMRYNAQGRAEPGCSLEPEVSADGKTYTFRIRPEACWVGPGGRKIRPVTADDFKRSWLRLLNPDSGSEYANIFFCIAGAEAYNQRKTGPEGVGIAAPDPATFVVTLANPTPFFKDLIAFTVFVPTTIDGLPDQVRGHFKPDQIVTNGPFLMESWKLNDRIRLRKNPHYWDAANVKLNTIDVLPISNATTALNLFLTGEADLIVDKGLVPPNLGDELRKQPYFHSKPYLATWFLRFNATKPPFNDARVRKAFALVIDKQHIVEKITRYGEPAAYSFVPPGAGENYQPPPGLEHDVEEARRLLAEAGYPGGKGFPLVGYLHPSLSIEPNIAVELQSMWERHLGVKITLPKQEYKAYLKSQSALNYDICRSSWIGDYNDPNTFLDMFMANSGNNRTGWSDAAYDKLIAEAAVQVDPKKRYEIFQQAEKMLVSEAAVICPVYHYMGIQFYHDDRFGGIEANVTDEHPLRAIFPKHAPGN